jgi:pyruvate formate lyase activating enzyme
MVAAARRAGAGTVVSSYNEPLITAEWAAAVFDAALKENLLCAMVTNGNATPDALDFLQMRLSAVKVDLKSFRDASYRFLGGSLEAVTQTIQSLHARGIWVEVVTLLVPGFNDSDAELRDMARFIASVSANIPWHVTAFHPDYRMTRIHPTRPRDLLRAAALGEEAGLNFVYAGNLPGQVGEWENTRCPRCQKTLVRRAGFRVLECRLDKDGRCPECRGRVPGLWNETVPDSGAGPWKGRKPRLLRFDE